MRALTFFTAAVLLSACGNWSNQDLDFVNALPDRESLKSKLPTASDKRLGGYDTRKDGLNVGDPSGAYASTKEAKATFNGLIDSILGLVDTIRQYPPTTRSSESRVWGPFTDQNNAGFEFRLTVTQQLTNDGDPQFAWALESHKVGSDYFPIVTGKYLPTTDTLAKGQGSMTVHVSSFKSQLKVDDGLKSLDQIDVSYVTDSFPNVAQMQFAFSDGNASGLSSIGYRSRIQADTSGALQFLATTPADPNIKAVEYTSVWLPSGAGKAVGTVREGLFTGASQTECWDESFHVTYAAQSWPGGATSGAVKDCADVPGF